ncbi:hypothetical protein HWI79_292 [Cryptosporidium felis]|nr:hypothetical protein HWI79_292 [Cryptosporidium felis]
MQTRVGEWPRGKVEWVKGSRLVWMQASEVLFDLARMHRLEKLGPNVVSAQDDLVLLQVCEKLLHQAPNGLDEERVVEDEHSV